MVNTVVIENVTNRSQYGDVLQDSSLKVLQQNDKGI